MWGFIKVFCLSVTSERQPDRPPLTILVSVVRARIGQHDLVRFAVFEHRQVRDVEPALRVVFRTMCIDGHDGFADESEGLRVHFADDQRVAWKVSRTVGRSEVPGPKTATT